MPDPRTTDGELMCPELYPAERVAKLKKELLRDFAAQFQQQPTLPRRAPISTGPGCRFVRSVRLGLRCLAVGSGISRPRNRPRERIQTGQPAPSSHAGRMASTASMMS